MEIIQHTVIYSEPENTFGYVGWPTVAKTADGQLFVAASGHRFTHICPWGRTYFWKSADGGEHWSGPSTINNTPLDDRDAGVVALGGKRLAVTWFTESTKGLYDTCQNWYRNVFKETCGDDKVWKLFNECLSETADETRRKWFGSWIRTSPDGECWGELREAPVNSPHGFIVLQDGSWLYVGKGWEMDETTMLSKGDAPIRAVHSTDEGKTWHIRGVLPLPADMPPKNAHEPYAIQLANGVILAAIRREDNFTTVFATSQNCGQDWILQEAAIAGAPPHLLEHSSGKIICTVTRRDNPYGIFATVSEDNGATWSPEVALRDDAPDWDLGYPSSVELDNGDILTVYYIKLASGKNTSLVATRWRL